MNPLLVFFKFIWKALNFIRKLTINFIFLLFVLLLATIVGLFNQHNKSTELVGEQGALWIALDGYLADNREANMTWQKALNKLDNQYVPRQISTFDLVYAIEAAESDDRIKGIVLDLNLFEGADLPALEYVGKALNSFKQNKPVIAFADNYSQDQYFLASFADEIYLNPIGTVAIEGVSTQNLYFKDMLEKLEVTPHIFRVGTYKSAVEPFLRNNMSPEAKTNTQRWLKGLWQNYIDVVAENRKISKQQILPEINQYLADLKALKGDHSAYIKQRQLVTHFSSRAELEKKLTALFFNENDQVKHVDFDTYLNALPDRLHGDTKHNNSTNKIAIVNVEGTIIDGASYENEVGGDSIAALLNQAAMDDDIKAVVLRVNSPGGSAFASEIIRQEIDHLQAKGKPVVTSMGGMAASGGYWIASTTDYIVADKNTITGSIGIFAMFPTFENSLKKIGVTADGVSTSPLSELSALSALNPQLNQIFQLEIEHGYQHFLDIVSRGRGLTTAEVDKVAQGQIWLGQEALQHKLVDELGGFERAVEKAKELANQKADNQVIDYSVEWLIEEDEGLKSLISSLQQSMKTNLTNRIINDIGLIKPLQKAAQPLNILTKFNDPKGQYLYCLNCAKLK